MSEKTLSRIEPRSLGKWSAAFSIVISGLMILLYLPFLLAGLFFSDVALTGLLAAVVGGIVVVLFSVAMYAIFGFVMGFVTAYFYNWFADTIGGLELEFEDQ